MSRLNLCLFTILVLGSGLSTAFLDKRSAKQVADDLYKRYWDHKECKNSGGEKKPAFQCTGILMRGVKHNVDFDQAWQLKTRNREKESFSVTFLRSNDAKWSRFPLGYETGFILYPHLHMPDDKNRYRAFCAFPIDAATNGRAGRHGCGKSDWAGDALNSGHCDKQGILTFDQWRKHFETETHGLSGQTAFNAFMRRQCSFDMRLPSSKATELFETVLTASKYLQGQDTFKYMYNELLFHTWNPSPKNTKKLPIEAFFYTSGSIKGKEAAKRFQAEYKRLTGEKRPIVGIQLPGPGILPKFKVWYL